MRVYTIYSKCVLCPVFYKYVLLLTVNVCISQASCIHGTILYTRIMKHNYVTEKTSDSQKTS